MTASLETTVAPKVLHSVVADLGTYPSWLDIVAAAEPLPGAPADSGARDAERSAWQVDLRARLGPFRRSKRLRMVRTLDSMDEVVFERQELDGREHSPWVLRALIDDSADGARLTMSLHYGGTLWVPMLDRLLSDEIERSRHRLTAVLAARS